MLTLGPSLYLTCFDPSLSFIRSRSNSHLILWHSHIIQDEPFTAFYIAPPPPPPPPHTPSPHPTPQAPPITRCHPQYSRYHLHPITITRCDYSTALFALCMTPLTLFVQLPIRHRANSVARLSTYWAGCFESESPHNWYNRVPLWPWRYQI